MDAPGAPLPRGGGRFDPDSMKKLRDEMQTLQDQFSAMKRDKSDPEAQEILNKINEKAKQMHAMYTATPGSPRDQVGGNSQERIEH
jgi:hypothetical protein